jgi:HSP20 family protein
MSTLTKSNVGRIRPGMVPSLFDKFFRNDLGEWFGKEFVDTIPGVNVTESKDAYHVEMAAPGLKKDDFKIKVDDHMISISCEKESETKTEEKEFTRREYNYSSFSRSFTLPEHVIQEKIGATYNDGILKLTLPKKTISEGNNTKQIPVS